MAYIAVHREAEACTQGGVLLPSCELLSMPAHMKVIHSELLGTGLSYVALQSCLHTPKTVSSKKGHPCSNIISFSTIIKPKLISLTTLYWDTLSVKRASLAANWCFKLMKALHSILLDAHLEQVSKSKSAVGIAYVSARILAS